MDTKLLPGATLDTGWLGEGHGVRVREVCGSNPGETTMIFAPVFPGETQGS